jgi:hypothetical protein
MITAKKTAKKTDEDVIIVLRLFLHRLRHAILKSSFILRSKTLKQNEIN